MWETSREPWICRRPSPGSREWSHRMVCRRCRKHLAENAERCPHCGTPNSGDAGMVQTSTVLISVDGADLVYRSVDEVPVPLRTRLLKSTNGANSATILIADRRGRR